MSLSDRQVDGVAVDDEASREIHTQGIHYLATEDLHARAWELAKRNSAKLTLSP